MTKYALVVPLYRSAANIPDLVAALGNLNYQLQSELEVIAVDDGCPENSGNLLMSCDCAFPLKVIFHSRNFGAFTAIRTGLEHVEGPFAAVMAADLQEPPELVLDFFDALSSDQADVVFGQRGARSDPWWTRMSSALFWKAYRRFILKDIPPGGVDIFGCNRRVMDAVLSIHEPNSSLIVQLFWVGFRRKFFTYDRRERTKGSSSWNLSRRLRYMMDSIFSYSDLPILAVLWLGIIGCAASLVYALVIIVARLLGLIAEPGFTSLVVLIVSFGSLSLLVQGVLGSYLWRALENTKHRPMRVISEVRDNGKH